MSRTLTSNNITFINNTDNRKLEVHITSNLPTTQIYDRNNQTYTPDWSSINLILNTRVYLNSLDVTDKTDMVVKWYEQIGTGVKTQIGTGTSLTINTNKMTIHTMITYSCEVTYQDISATAQLTFARVDTGLNGSDGTNGTSVVIDGTAYYKGTLTQESVGQTVLLYSDEAFTQPLNISQMTAGDSYIVQGYLCVFSPLDGNFICAGTIQGPQGLPGESAKSITLDGNSQIFRVNTSNVVSPSTITVMAQAFNTQITNWTYSVDGGQTFLSTPPTGVTRNGVLITITGSTMQSNSIVIKASDGVYSDTYTVYKTFDGAPGKNGDPTPIAFLTNENVTFSANAQGQILGTTITSNVVAYNGTTKVIPTIGTITGIPIGMTITPSTINSEIKLNIAIANNSTLGSNSSNMGVIQIPITSPIDTTLYLTWSKVNTGTPGIDGNPGSDAYTVVLTNESNTFVGDISNAIAGSVTTQVLAYKGSAAQTVTISSVNGKSAATTDTDTGITGLKFRCSTLSGTSPIITFTCTTAFKSANGSIPIILSVGGISFTKVFTYSIAFKGTQGNPGNPGTPGAPATSYWLVSSADVVQKTSTGIITLTPSTLTFTGKSQTGTATPIDYACRWIIAYSTDGTNYTNLYTSTANETSKSITVATTYKTIRVRMYLAGGTTTLLDEQIIPVVSDGVTGPKGNDAYTVMLTNESHIFAGDISNAIAGSTTTQVLAYNGSTTQTVTIVSVNGKTAATTDMDTGIAGLKFKCSTLSGTTPTITFTCTTAFVNKSGTIPIVLSVGGVSFTKMFTYSIAFKGTTGSPGNPGSPGTPASLVDVTPSALYFKSTTGKGGTFTPDYIYLYPRFQTVTYNKWEYSTNGGTSWTTVTSGSNGLTIGTYNSVPYSLQIAKNSALYTDTITSISFRCVSSNTSVYDTVSIAKIYDVVDLQIGGRNLLTNSGYMTDLNGWTVYTSNYPVNDLKLETNDIYGSVLTATGTAASSRIRVGQYIPYLQKTNRTLTFSMIYQASVDSTSVTAGGKYSELDNSGEYGSFSGTNTKRTDLGNGFTYMETTFNLTYTEATRSFFVYIYPGVQTTKIVYCKLEDGNKATVNWSPAPEDLKTFQLYAPKGYLITNDVPEVTLQTFAYEGSRAITNATFKWYSWFNDDWIVINGATSDSLVIGKSDVLKSNVYKCEMTYRGIKYEATATVEDKTDVYESIMCISSNARGNDCYWVLYTLVYTNAEEIDPLLGPISINAPESPVSGDYWYAVDANNASVQLKKYNGTSWANSTDTQSLSYYWDIVNDGSTKVPFGNASKVQVISCHDFTSTATLVCEVNNTEDGLLTQSSLSLTDASDPIVSATEPMGMVDGQIWIKPNDNGTYFMSVWDATNEIWITSDMDSRTKVYTSRPSSYKAGDLWVTASDTDHNDYLAGTLLQANTTSTTYNANHWSATLKYDKDLDKIKETLNDLSEYVNITSEGLKISAMSASGEISPFTSLFTSTELAFYQNSEKLLTLTNSQLITPHVVVEDEIEVQGTISLGNLSLTIESNGSFSFAVSK